ncbi:MAG: type I methionyl aminopeptidase [Puniceicoccales bacterium]|jgi:methionyl aminopeptidase|nr:type I methionyl aminopeptidase [Puniceicoccales bacterium]
MITIKNSEEIVAMRKVGRITADILAEICAAVAIGVSTWELDQLAIKSLKAHNAVGACYNYQGRSRQPFPAHICISLNDEIVHGIPSKTRKIQSGDIVSLDLVAQHEGFMGDSTQTVAVGDVSDDVKKLLSVTERALHAGAEQAIEGNHVGDISFAIQRCAEEADLGIVRNLVGHGIGRNMHEEPNIPNFGEKGKGPRLEAGMTFAIEPMLMLGSEKILLDADGWTVRTADGKYAAHFEHTVLVTKGAPEILTRYVATS